MARRAHKVTFGRLERIDSHSAELDIYCDGEDAGTLIKLHGEREGALSLTDTPGRVESYEVELDGRGSRVFHVESYGNDARRALKAAKEWARRQLERGPADDFGPDNLGCFPTPLHWS